MLAVDDNGGVFRLILVDGELAGLVTLSPDHEVMVAVLSHFRRKGVALGALMGIARIAFDELGIERITAKGEIGRPSTFLATKLGATEIGRTDSEVFFEYTIEMWRGGSAK